MNDDVLLVQQSGYIATLTINRPEKRNALNPEIHAGLVHHIDRFADEGEEVGADGSALAHLAVALLGGGAQLPHLSQESDASGG